MRRLIPLLPIATLIFAGCWGAESDKQWYKPNVDYTAADFERDRVACTDKKKVLDEECMKQRGWATLGGDIGSPPKAEDPTRGTSKKSSKY